MKIDQALANANDEWFRPALWVGSGQAYCIKDGATYLVPSSKGAEFGMTPYAEFLMCDWEIVSPETVLDELLHD